MFSMNVCWWWKLLCKRITPTIVGIACALLRQTSNIHTVHYYPPPKAEGYCFCIVRTSVLPSVRHFCIQSHILEVLWRIYWNLVWVYIWIRGWWTPNVIVHHLLITELWLFVSWKNAFFLWQSSRLAGDINSKNLLVIFNFSLM